MESHPENRYGASVAVERRVGNELVIQREVGGLPDGKIVIGFQDFFAAVGQVAVAVQDARAACLQEFYAGRREAPLRTPARPKVSSGRFHAAPLTLTPSDADQLASVYVHATSWPSFQPSRENTPTFFASLLFPVQPEAVFVAVGERGGRDG